MKIFDAHLHIIDYHFPIIHNQGYLPPNYTVEDYLNETKPLNIIGGAIVSGSFQGYDQTYFIHALKKLGPNFCGVTQLPFSVTDDEIIDLDQNGVKAVRFNIKRGSFKDFSQIDYFARRVYELAGWHSEFYVDAKDLPEIASIIKHLPAVSIDHLGLSEEGLLHVLHLVEKGLRVKATGFGRVQLNVPKALKAIYNINPDALMFGTDLPSTRAKRRFNEKDITLIRELFDEEAVRKILYENAVTWYFNKK